MLIQRSWVKYPLHDLWDYVLFHIKLQRNYKLPLGIAEWENEVSWWEGCRNSAVEARDSWQRAWDGSSQSDVADSRTDHRGKINEEEAPVLIKRRLKCKTNWNKATDIQKMSVGIGKTFLLFFFLNFDKFDLCWPLKIILLVSREGGRWKRQDTETADQCTEGGSAVSRGT